MITAIEDGYVINGRVYGKYLCYTELASIVGRVFIKFLEPDERGNYKRKSKYNTHTFSELIEDSIPKVACSVHRKVALQASAAKKAELLRHKQFLAERRRFYRAEKVAKLAKEVACQRFRELAESDPIAKVLLLLEKAESANRAAKVWFCDSRLSLYRDKQRYLSEAFAIMDMLGWDRGFTQKTGKAAPYLLYCYLPDGSQVSWHSFALDGFHLSDNPDFVWDGMVNSTSRKIEKCRHNLFSEVFAGCRLAA